MNILERNRVKHLIPYIQNANVCCFVVMYASKCLLIREEDGKMVALNDSEEFACISIAMPISLQNFTACLYI